MRFALRPNNKRVATNSSKSFPSPVGGWNAKDSLAEMKENEAVILINWYPESSHVRSRAGYDSWSTGLGTGLVESLMTYTGLSTQKLFGCANNAIYDCSTNGAASSVVSGLSNNRWQYENFGNSAGNFLFCANGVDTPRKYDGSSWATMSLSGVTPENIIMFKSYKERLFAIENNSLKFWYLPVNNISGAMTSFDLGPYCSKGGYLQFVATWSRDAGDGSDDYIVFGTSEGEILIYTGTDPSSAADWRITDIYSMPEPIGRRCAFRVGSDLIIVTKAGFVPLSKVILFGLYVNKAAVSDKIETAINTAVSVYGGNYGWQGIFFPIEHMGIFNIPVSPGTEQRQYVVNVNTGAWCEFRGFNANCWGLFGDYAYFGGNDGTVYRALYGTDDNGSSVQTTALTSFSYFNTRGKRKRWTLARPIFRSTGNLAVSTSLSVDFEENLPSYPDNVNESSSGTAWNAGAWNTFPWAGGFRVLKNWRGVIGSGICAALGVRTSTRYQQVQWLSTDYNYEVGGVI